VLFFSPRSSSGPTEEKKSEESGKYGERKVMGVVTNYGANDDAAAEDEEAEDVPNNFSNSWKLNVTLGIVSCWFAMSLTGWGSIESGGNVANPEVGSVSMWMIISSQWLVLTLYLWTLVAPRLFPNREFS
jgi:hypothetical protein